MDQTPHTPAPGKVFLQKVFSDNGEPSSSRILTFILALVGVAIIVGVAQHICHLHDNAALGLWLTAFPSIVFALIAFMNAPYLINRGSGSLSDIAAVFRRPGQ